MMKQRTFRTDFLSLLCHEESSQYQQLLDNPVEIKMTQWTKIVMAKACKAFGVNVNGFEHEILEMILRMEQKRKLQLQQQREKKKDAKISKKKGDGEATEGRMKTQEEKYQILNLKLEIQRSAKAEEASWRQKSRCLWLKEGDRNTKFFQRVANANRRYNRIDKLLVEEEIIEDKELIKEEILSFYQSLYTEEENSRPTTSFEGMGCLTTDEKMVWKQLW
ncbi:hypothetical protein H5410_003216 [Solanum commersonii]|uniref:Uncharacterized protein n=1 Tax=Solanum commersonii TaxID=4109 RepID=A0A9J6B4F2_SOLCO|nr:hypothetical protein H5410_003216 [Solanum commersonii]